VTTADGSEPTGFLYPFIEGEERDAGGLLTDLAASARAKIAESHRLQASTVAARAGQIEVLATEMAHRFVRGGRLFTFGNGGSATDAEMAADLFRRPPPASGPWISRPGEISRAQNGLAATSLVADPAVLTALANDVGVELVFSRQLIAHARAGDMALGFSTSGGSANVLRAFAEGRARGLLTAGLAGYGGGAMATCGDLDHCMVVESDSVHRIQEAQAALVRALWEQVLAQLASGPDEGTG
jgi:D-sedoheptulose 7-phosphate isomerase